MVILPRESCWRLTTQLAPPRGPRESNARHSKAMRTRAKHPSRSTSETSSGQPQVPQGGAGVVRSLSLASPLWSPSASQQVLSSWSWSVFWGQSSDLGLSRNRLPNGLSSPIRLATNRGKYGQVNFPPVPHVTHVPTSLLCRQSLRFGQGLPGRSEPHPVEFGEAPLMDAVRKISLPQRFQK